MKLKNFLALILAIVMLLTLFAACGEKEKSEGNNAPVSPSTAVSNDPSDSGDDEPEELREINVWLADMGQGGLNTKSADVGDALNEIMLNEYNIKVNLIWNNMSDIGTQFTLAVSNKEAIDIILTTPAPNASFTTYYSGGMLMDISSYIDEYAPDLKALMAPLNLLGAYTMPDGGLYGIPTYRILNSNLYLIMRNDILEASGALELAQSMATWSDFEEVLRLITAEGSQYGTADSMGDGMSIGGFAFGSGDFKNVISYDNLSDGLGVVYSDQSGNVSLLYENDIMVDQYKMVSGWYKNGYIYADSVYANEPEAALTFLNALYTRSDLMNLITWGIEGETYEVKDSGEGGYIGDADATTSGYHGADFLVGNQFLVLPWQGSGADFRVKAEESLTSAPVSAYMGLTIDTAGYDTLVSAISAVKSEYHSQIAGGLYTDALFAEFLQKLDSAGVDEYIALFQSAVDGFAG